MKLGISMYSYVRAVRAGQLDIQSFIREAARLGAEGVELLDFFYGEDWDADRKRALEALKETGLVCGVFSVANNFAKSSEADRIAALDTIKRGVDEAQHYGAKVVRVFSGDISENSDFTVDQAMEWIIDGLALASNYALNADVRLALENHGRLAGKSSQINEIVHQVRERSASASLGSNPDTGNFLLVGEPGHVGVAEVAHTAYMMHFKDFGPCPPEHEGHAIRTDSGELLIGTVIGEGMVDLRASLQALKDVNFEGWVNLEYEGEGNPMVDVPKSYENARRMMQLVVGEA